MTAYVDSLPRGLDSYPDFLQKASLYRDFLAQLPSRELIGHPSFPPTLSRLIEHPEPVSVWLPEAWATAVSLAIADLHFPSDADFIASKLAANRRLFKSPLYRLLIVVASPEMLFRATGKGWDRLHKGIQLRPTLLGDGRSKARLSFPAFLVPQIYARAYACSMQAAIEAAGGREARVELVAWGPSSADYEGTWR